MPAAVVLSIQGWLMLAVDDLSSNASCVFVWRKIWCSSRQKQHVETLQSMLRTTVLWVWTLSCRKTPHWMFSWIGNRTGWNIRLMYKSKVRMRWVTHPKHTECGSTFIEIDSQTVAPDVRPMYLDHRRVGNRGSSSLILTKPRSSLPLR